MDQKRKISVRKVLQVLFTLVVVTGCTVALLSATKSGSTRHLKGVDIDITNGDNCHFLNEDQVKKMILGARHANLQNEPVNTIDINTMEKIITGNPWVANGQVYIDNNHVLHATVQQRVPVVRIFESDGDSYYLDASLKTVPLSANYVQYTSIVTNVPPYKNDSEGNLLKGQILSLVRFIERDTFWNAQVSQVMMDSTAGFEIIPVLGNHKIIIGDTSRLKEKFDNLFVFYKKVLNRIGWDKYETLDVRFKNQVVASPSLPYKGPVDKVMNTMSWVNSITDSNAKGYGIATKNTVVAHKKLPAATTVKVVAKPLEAKGVKKNIVNGSAHTLPAKATPAKGNKKTNIKAVDKKVDGHKKGKYIYEQHQ